MATKPSLALKRRLKAPPSQVFQAWTVPEKMTQWWGGSDPTSRVAEADVRIGGRFHVGFKGNNGEQNDVSGVYREIVADRRLVFTWAWRTTPERESQVTVDLKPDGDGTILTLTHEQFFSEKARDDHRVGWSIGLDHLERLFA